MNSRRRTLDLKCWKEEKNNNKISFVLVNGSNYWQIIYSKKNREIGE